MVVNLSDIEKLALKIIALVRNGMLPGWTCEGCDGELQEIRNCKAVEQDSAVLFNPMFGELTACPFKYIPDSVWGFLDEYDYMEKYPATAKPYNKCNPRFWAAVRFFESVTCEVLQSKKNKPESNIDTGASLRNRFLKKA